MKQHIICKTSIPESPIPSWHDLFRLMLDRRTDLQAPLRPWCSEGQSFYLFSRASWAIAGFVQWHFARAGKKKITVYLPDYFCDLTLAPLRRRNIDLVFYPITEDFRPDWACIEHLEKRSAVPDIFILVHYFGFSCAADTARRFCDLRGTLLFEDCAHVLAPTENIGRKGDAVVYSLHKVLGIPTAGLLIMNKALFTSSSKQDTHADSLLTYRSSDSKHRCPSSGLWVIKKIVQRILIGVHVGWKREIPARYDTDEEEVLSGDWGIDGVTEKLLKIFQNQISIFMEQRVDNYMHLHSALSKIDGVLYPICKELPSGSAPYLYPLRVDKKYINKLYVAFNKKGVIAKPWPYLPREVIGSSREHPMAMKIRGSLITLPAHHSLTKKQIMTIEKRVKELTMDVSR